MSLPHIPAEVIEMVLRIAAPVLARPPLLSTGLPTHEYYPRRAGFADLARVSRDWYYAIQPALFHEIALFAFSTGIHLLPKAISRSPGLVRTLIIDSRVLDYPGREELQFDRTQLDHLVESCIEQCVRLSRIESYGWNSEGFAEFKEDRLAVSMPCLVHTKSLVWTMGCSTAPFHHALKLLESSLEYLEIHRWTPGPNFADHEIPVFPRLSRLRIIGGTAQPQDIPILLGLSPSTLTLPHVPKLRELVLYNVDYRTFRGLRDVLSHPNIGPHLSTLGVILPYLSSHDKDGLWAIHKSMPGYVLELCPNLAELQYIAPIPIESFSTLPSQLRRLTIRAYEAHTSLEALLRFVTSGRLDRLQKLVLQIDINLRRELSEAIIEMTERRKDGAFELIVDRVNMHSMADMLKWLNEV